VRRAFARQRSDSLQRCAPTVLLAQVLVNIAVQNVALPWLPGRKHSLSRLVHNSLVPYLLVEAHSGQNA
jgi:hypothetical protein